MDNTFIEKKKANMIAVCGVKNSGKTTLLEKLLKGLARRGIKAAVIKHDGHDFSCDRPGTDSFRLWQAGAYGTAVFSGQRVFLHKKMEEGQEELLLELFPEADIIFLEGRKESGYPKIEVIRKAVSKKPVSNPQGRFLIVTDYEPETFSEPAVGLEDIDIILEKVVKLCKLNF